MKRPTQQLVYLRLGPCPLIVTAMENGNYIRVPIPTTPLLVGGGPNPMYTDVLELRVVLRTTCEV